MAGKCVLLLSALALLRTEARVQKQRCAQDASGDLVGNVVTLEKIELLPAGRKVYVHPIAPLPGRELNGVSARVCDLYSPEVNVEANKTQVTVRRLGPRMHPITLEVMLYFDPLIPQEAEIVNF